jgi:hypothetical protein
MTETQLTGAQVRAWREDKKLSRREFAELCGFPTQTRLFNIEQKDSWKDGDLEAVQGAMSRVESNPPAKTKKSRNKAEANARVEQLMNKLHDNGKLVGDQPAPDEVHDIETTTGVDPEDPPPATWVSEPNQVADPGILDPTVGPDGLARITAPLPTVCPDCGNPRLSRQHVKACKAPHVQDVDRVTELINEGVEEGYVDREIADEIIQQVTTDPGLRVGDLAGDDEKLLTNSEVAVWNRCRRKWWLAFYRRLAYGKIDYSGPREIGNRVHRALAAWYVPEGVEPKDPREALNEAIIEDWTKIEEQVRTHGVQGDVEQVLADRATAYHEACNLERAVVEGYVQWLTETGADANMRVTEPESVLTARIEHEIPQLGEKIAFIGLGKLDARIRRLSDGVRLFMDHKTTGSLTEPLKTLHMDPQMLHYHLLEWLNSSEGDERCDAALYNMLKKVKRTGTAKLPFFDRVEVHHNPHSIDAYKRRLVGAARDIERATHELDAGVDPMIVVYPNPTRSCSWDCDFFSICPMFDDGSRVEDAITALYHEQDPLARYAKDQEVGGI